MSLHTRLIGSITLVLLVSFAAALLSAGWGAARSVRAELRAALTVAEQTVRHAYEDLPAAQDPMADLGRLVQAFDGHRHVRIVLLDSAGQPAAASALLQPAQPVPGWFARFVAPVLPPILLPLDTALGRRTMVLAAEPWNELGEVWAQLRASLALLVLSCGMSVVVISLLLNRALRPLKQVSAAFAAVGPGGYTIRLPRAGTRELDGLVHGFNTMATRIGAAEARNRALQDQLVTLQEEERAALARDLHDEVGPFLFTAALDAAEIEQAAAAGRHGVIAERALAIREAVVHMQRHVRAMLNRLRQPSPVDAGLAPALDNLVVFWRQHRPGIVFIVQIDIDEDSLAEETKTVIYRVAQEGLSNAVRHAYPRRIEVAVEPGERRTVLVRVSDDGVGLAPGSGPGLGLAGMQERVAALGGSLQVTARPGGSGSVVVARLPARLPARSPAALPAGTMEPHDVSAEEAA